MSPFICNRIFNIRQFVWEHAVFLIGNGRNNETEQQWYMLFEHAVIIKSNNDFLDFLFKTLKTYKFLNKIRNSS